MIEFIITYYFFSWNVIPLTKDDHLNAAGEKPAEKQARGCTGSIPDAAMVT